MFARRPPLIPGTCTAESEVTKPVGTTVIDSSVTCQNSGNLNPDLPQGTPLTFCDQLTDDSGNVVAMDYPRCLPACTVAENARVSSCLSTCPTGWGCCSSLGDTCISFGNVCPACPDCADDTLPCPSTSFLFDTPTGQRECCHHEPPSPPISPPSLPPLPPPPSPPPPSPPPSPLPFPPPFPPYALRFEPACAHTLHTLHTIHSDG